MHALVLSGGGAKGQYQVGALQYLMRDLGVQYDVVCGVSVGALIASYICQFPVGDEVEAIEALTKLFSSIEDKDVWKRWWPFGALHGLWKGGMLNSRPLRDTIDKHLDADKVRSSGRQLRIGATSLNAGRYRIFTQDSVPLKDYIYASAAFPVAFPPVEIGQELWSDGGIRTVTPLKAAIDSGANRIDVVMTSPEHSNPRSKRDPNAVDVAFRTVELMSDQIVDDDVKKALLYNKLVEAGIDTEKRNIDMRIIRPSKVLLQNALSFDPAKALQLQAQGYADAMQVVSG